MSWKLADVAIDRHTNCLRSLDTESYLYSMISPAGSVAKEEEHLLSTPTRIVYHQSHELDFLGAERVQ